MHCLAIVLLLRLCFALNSHVARDENAPTAYFLGEDIAHDDVSPVEKPADPDFTWQCLCRGAMLEFYIRRGIYMANTPDAPQQAPGPGDPNTPSVFQDPSDLQGYRVRISRNPAREPALEPPLQALGVLDRSYLEWWADVTPLLINSRLTYSIVPLSCLTGTDSSTLPVRYPDVS